MEMEKVDSSFIKAIGHDPLTSKMHIEFRDGDTFEYEGLSENQVKAFKNSSSVGKHFHKIIKPFYTAKKVK